MATQDKLVTPADRFNPLMTAADVMTAAPRTCSTFSTVVEAVLIFRDADCGLVPILGDNGQPVGVLTDRDVALALIEHTSDLPTRPVSDIMTRDVATVKADAKLDAVEEAMAGRKVRRLLVVDSDDRLLGVISWSDLSPHLSDCGLGGIVDQVVREP
jgi:CBS domain-containing protein